MNAGSIVGCSTPNRLTTGEAFHGGIYAFGPMANADTTGVITLTGGLIKNNGRYDINAAYMTTIYANGGEVYGGVHLNQSSKITCLAEDNGITAFKGKTVIGGTSSVNPSHVDWGLFYGGLDIYGNTTGVIVTYKDGDSEHAKQVLPSGTLATRPDDPTATPGPPPPPPPHRAIPSVAGTRPTARRGIMQAIKSPIT
ncbi:unknown [Anaerotruncus sp. CAG:528]|nr:unknown [Anaerotruncus sp. CAG:528]